MMVKFFVLVLTVSSLIAGLPADDQSNPCTNSTGNCKSVLVSSCGHHSNFPEPGLVSKLITPADSPWLVVVTGLNGLICSGAIIDAYWIISTKGCFMPAHANHTDTLDNRTFAFHNDVQQGKVIEPTNTYFCSFSDLALVRLKKPIEFNNYLQPLCLPIADDELGGRGAMAYYYNSMSKRFEMSAAETYMDEKSGPCSISHDIVPKTHELVCAEVASQGCHATDHGHLLVRQYQYKGNKVAVLIGLYAAAISCHGRYQVNQYTRMTWKVRHWIATTTKLEEARRNYNVQKIFVERTS